MTWTSGIDGGDWVWCRTCRCSTPPTEQGTCATCGSVIVPKAEPQPIAEDAAAEASWKESA